MNVSTSSTRDCPRVGPAAALAALLLHPAWLKHPSDADGGRVAVGLMYALWWLAAGLVVAYGLALRRGRESFRGTRLPTAGVGHVFVGVLLASLVAHLGTAHWVYKSPFHPANLSPLLAALPVVFARLPETKSYRRRDAAVLCLLLPVAAVLTSLDRVPGLSMNVFGRPVEPIMLALAAAYLAIVDAFAPAMFLRLAGVGVAAGVVYVVGPTAGTVRQWAAAVDRVTADAVAALVPTTQAAWGFMAGAGAFVMLAAGAAVSLLRPADEPATTDGAGVAKEWRRGPHLVPSPGMARRGLG